MQNLRVKKLGQMWIYSIKKRQFHQPILVLIITAPGNCLFGHTTNPGGGGGGGGGGGVLGPKTDGGVLLVTENLTQKDQG